MSLYIGITKKEERKLKIKELKMFRNWKEGTLLRKKGGVLITYIYACSYNVYGRLYLILAIRLNFVHQLIHCTLSQIDAECLFEEFVEQFDR